MGLIELIVGLLVLLLLINIVFALVPIPRGIGGLLIALLIVYLLFRLVF